MASEKESNGRKESVKIRQRKLSDGTTSLYLDIMHNGKRTREFLKLYLNEEKSRADKEYNPDYGTGRNDSFSKTN